MKNALIFYCPSKKSGGTEVLFHRLIERAKNDAARFEVFLLDENGGVLSTSLKEISGITILSKIEEIPFDRFKESILLIPAKAMHQLYELLLPTTVNVRLIIWQLGHGGLSENLLLPLWLKYGFKGFAQKLVKSIVWLTFNRTFTKAKRFLKTIIEKKALAFTDYIGALETYSDFSLIAPNTADIPIIPVFTQEVDNQYLIKHNFKVGQLNIGWLGRIDKDFKIYSIIDFISKSSKYALAHNTELFIHLVGDGNAFDIIEKEKERYPNVHIITYGRLDNNSATSLLLNKADIAIVMGTSSLDLGRYGIPTVIVTPVSSFKDIHLIKYRWLSDPYGFSLGEFPGGVKVEGFNEGRELDVLLDELIENYTVISKSTALAIDQYFTINVAYDSLVRLTQDSAFDTQLFKQMFKAFYRSRNFVKKITRVYKPNWAPT